MPHAAATPAGAAGARRTGAGSGVGLRVALDARMAGRSGIGRYVRCLVRELLRQDPDLGLTLLAPRGAAVERWAGARAETVVFEAPIYTLAEQWAGFGACRRLAGRVSVFHFPHYNAPAALPRRSLVTVHDLTHFGRYGWPRGRTLAARFLLGAVVRRAARIVAVSEATRDALEARFPAARGKTEVVHLGVDEPFRPLPAAELADFARRERVERCLLFVGIDRPHKNLAGLLATFDRVRRARPAVELVVVSDRPPEARAGIAGVRFLTALPDAELARWYGVADALVVPSRSEGFGLPALEAMACGTPVIVSDIPALREVAGEAGLFVEPDDEDGWAAALLAVLDDDARRREMAARALRRAGAFSWARAAERTRRLYAEIAGLS